MSVAPLPILTILLLAASCGSGHDGTVQKPIVETATRVLGTMAYDCDDSTYVVASLDEATGGLWVFLPQETVLLPHVPAASGTRYSNGTVTLWSKGREAVVEQAGMRRRCTENRRRSVIEAAKLRGSDYWATGNEPGWQLEIGPEFTVWTTDYGQTVHTMPTPEPIQSDDRPHTTYEGHFDGVTVRIVIDRTPCRDSMSDESFASSVSLTWGDRTFHGCGQALH